MIDAREHCACVDAWQHRAFAKLSPEQQLSRFELTFSAVLTRAHQTLGEVTLLAIADRVLAVAAEGFPLAAQLQVEATRIRRSESLSARDLHHEQVVLATRFVLVEFLTVLGKLTAEILTPALHAELAHELHDGGCEERSSQPSGDLGVAS